MKYIYLAVLTTILAGFATGCEDSMGLDSNIRETLVEGDTLRKIDISTPIDTVIYNPNKENPRLSADTLFIQFQEIFPIDSSGKEMASPLIAPEIEVIKAEIDTTGEEPRLWLNAIVFNSNDETYYSRYGIPMRLSSVSIQLDSLLIPGAYFIGNYQDPGKRIQFEVEYFEQDYTSSVNLKEEIRLYVERDRQNFVSVEIRAVLPGDPKQGAFWHFLVIGVIFIQF